MAKTKSTTAKKTEKKDTVLSVPVSPVVGETAPAVFEKSASVIPFEVKKQELSRTAPRTQTVPNTLQDEIRMRAYELYVQRGYSTGNPTEDWLDAEREVMQRYNHHHSA